MAPTPMVKVGPKDCNASQGDTGQDCNASQGDTGQDCPASQADTDQDCYASQGDTDQNYYASQADRDQDYFASQGDTDQFQQHHPEPEPVLPPEVLPGRARTRGRWAKHATTGRSSNSRPDGRPVVKTKFAITRMKRIIQSNREVGKLCKVVPVLIAEALERFMISLCEKAGEQARHTNSRRVLPSHLKEAVKQVDSFDFLKDFVSGAPDLASLFPQQAATVKRGGRRH